MELARLNERAGMLIYTCPNVLNPKIPFYRQNYSKKSIGKCLSERIAACHTYSGRGSPIDTCLLQAGLIIRDEGSAVAEEN